jgi:FAD/FMN-containing dehydrogenase
MSELERSAARQSLLATLTGLLGPKYVLSAAREMAPYLNDWRGRYHGHARCVVRPGSVAEVQAVVQACLAARTPMLPQGGNTSLCGAATPDLSGEAVVISLSRLNRVLAVDAANLTLTVEAGCPLASVQAAAEAAGCLFPLSLASEGSCQIGGNVSTNAGGVQVLRYGTTRDLVLGMQAVLPDGQLWDGLRGLRKDNTGYSLKHLLIGAEGTLGVITALVLKLFPLPTARQTVWLGLPSPEAAVSVLNRMQSAFDARLTAFELVSRPSLALVLQHFDFADPLPAPYPWYVLAEVTDSGPATSAEAALQHTLEQVLEAAIAEGLVGDATLAQSLTQARQLWALRENISDAQKLEGISIKHDIAVPVSQIPVFLQQAEVLLTARFPGVRIVAFGHVGDGNLHYNLSKPDAVANADFLVQQDEVNGCVHDLVHQLHGSISAEHGIGQLKREELLRYKSPVEMAAMRAIKLALDPLNLMNPGKVL